MPLGLGTGQLLGLLREARGLDERPSALLVIGPLADVLAGRLAAGADDASVVRTAGDVRGAAALVLVLASEARGDALRLLRDAASAHVPIVAIRLDDDQDDVPYVLAEHVVDVGPGEGFPVDRIAAALAAALGRDAVPLARRLPVLRDEVERRRFRRALVQSAIIGAAPWSGARHFPLLTVAQARMLMEIDAATGRARTDDVSDTARAAGLPLAVAVGTGIAARALYRRIPVGGPVAAGAIAVLGTVAVRVVGRVASSRL